MSNRWSTKSFDKAFNNSGFGLEAGVEAGGVVDAAGAAVLRAEPRRSGRGVVASRMHSEGTSWDLFHVQSGGTDWVEYRVLGPLEAIVGGRSVELGPPRHRALLVLWGREAIRVGDVVRHTEPDMAITPCFRRERQL